MTLPSTPLPTLAEMEALLLSNLPSNFPVNNSDEFGVFRIWTLLAAKAALDSMAFTQVLIPQGFPLLASNAWLDEHMASVGEARIPASFAEHNVQFSVSANTTIAAGDILQTDPDAFGNRLRFIVVEDTTLTTPSGLVRVRAEQAGSAYNVGAGRINTLVTINPAVTAVTNLSDSLTLAGVDQETDDLLRERYLLAWTGISTGGSWRNYVRWAREVPGITKVRVMDNHPRGQGTVDVIVAPSTGLPTEEQIDAVQVIVEENRPVTADVDVIAPTPAVTAVTLTVYPKPGVTTTVPQWQARVQAIIDQQGIGDTLYPSSLYDGLMNSGELVGLVIAAPAAPVDIPDTSLITAGAITVTVAP